MCIQPAFSQPATASMNTIPQGAAPSQGVPLAGLRTPVKLDDQKFAKDAALGALAEVELGKLAVQKASRDDIKQFARRIIGDQAQANDLLMQVARKVDITMPGELDSKHRSRVDKLSKLSGEDFDRAYMQDQLKDRQAQIRDFRAESQAGADPTLKAFASYMLPRLQEDLKLAKSLNKAEKIAANEPKGQ
jgi:putative membrane protein